MTCLLQSQDGSAEQTVSAQDKTEEFLTDKPKEVAYLNYKRIYKTNCDVAKTLCARDYKGFGTGYDTMNGVISRSEN